MLTANHFTKASKVTFDPVYELFANLVMNMI